jgi:5-formyltetrahydrofolate cyclo-ligase
MCVPRTPAPGQIPRPARRNPHAEYSARAAASTTSGGVTVRDDKRTLRQQLLARRPAMIASRPPGAWPTLRDRYLAAFDPAPGLVVSAFWPMDDELDLRPLLDALHARGCICALPVVIRGGQPLEFRSWEPGTQLAPSRFGVAEPGPERPTVRPDHALVPLLAFDDGGYRLGYGGGFYDRTLAMLRADGRGLVAIGVGLAAQRVPALPREPFDARLDWILTETSLTRVPTVPVR